MWDPHCGLEVCADAPYSLKIFKLAIFRSKNNNQMHKFHEQIFLIRMVFKVKSPGTWPHRKLPEFPDWSSCLSSCDPCRTRGRGSTPALDPIVMSILELRTFFEKGHAILISGYFSNWLNLLRLQEMAKKSVNMLQSHCCFFQIKSWFCPNSKFVPLPYYNIRARGQPIIHLLIPPIARIFLLNPLLFSFRRIEQWDLFIIVLLRPYPARRQVVFHSCSQREVVIPGGKNEINN